MTGTWRLIGVAVAAVVLAGALPVAASANDDGPTFTKDVLPILQRSCQGCHRPGTAAPMALLTYDDVRPWAHSIKDRVTRRQDAAVAPRPRHRGGSSGRW